MKSKPPRLDLTLAVPPKQPGLVGRIKHLTLGEQPSQELPHAVRHAIEDSQRSSEILVCCVQYGAIAFFGAFYVLTPKAFPDMVPFEPVPWALASYGLFTTIRLWLAMKDRLTPAFLSISVIVDILLLMLTIWSFHLQYQQPATTYLKAPTLLYVFIFIALRTLRYEAAYVLLGGAAAILGWVALVVYAVFTAGDMRITRSFAEYVTSDAILIGAEVDKIVSIGAVTAILAIAVTRARNLLIRSTTEARAASELSRFFAPEVAGEIRNADIGLRPGDAVRREAAVMVVDLRDFTGLAARNGPGEIMALLSEYHRRIVPVIHRHGGSIDKYLGDGIMATFGAAQPSNTYATDALRGLRAVLIVAEEWNSERQARGEEQLGLGIAVAVGPVLFGVTGDQSRLEFTVIGEVANVAAKLEKHCKAVSHPALATLAALELARVQGFSESDACDLLLGERVAGLSAKLDVVALR